MGNGYGPARVSRAVDMAAYDQSPPPLRWLMRNTVADWSARDLLVDYSQMRRDGRDHASAMAEIVRFVSARELQRTAQFYGPNHPEAARRDH